MGIIPKGWGWGFHPIFFACQNLPKVLRALRDYCTTAVWHYGTTALRLYGATRHYSIMALRHYGTMYSIMTWTWPWRWTWTWIRSRGLPGPSISFTSYNGQKVGCHNSDGQHQKCQGIARIFFLIYILTGVLPGVNLTNDFSEALVSKRYFCKVYRYHFLNLSDAGV